MSCRNGSIRMFMYGGLMTKSGMSMALFLTVAGVALQAQEPVPRSGVNQWARLSKLKPGTVIVLTVRGSQPLKRVFVAADDTRLMLLNAVDPRGAVESQSRADIAQVTMLQRGAGVWGHLGLLGGYFVGAIGGGYIAGLGCQAAANRDRCDSGAFLDGMVFGGVAGASYGFHAARKENEKVIYSSVP